MPGRLAGNALALGLALAVGAAGVGIGGCGDPPFELEVTFAGPLEVDPGAEVRYQGVAIGDVDHVSLRQTAPEQPALVVLSLSIRDDDVTLREGDVFEVVSDGLMGDPYVRVTARRESARPLESGATVAGRAPFLTRFLETADESIGSLGELAREQRDEWLDALRDATRPDATDAPDASDPQEGADAPGAPREADTPR